VNIGLIVAAGKSERMAKKVDKAFLSLGAQPVLAYSVAAYEKCPDIDKVILVVRKDRLDAARGLVRLFGCAKVARVVAGGASRQVSVCNGLALLDDDTTLVSIHDGARPCVTPKLISETVKAAKRYGSGVSAVKITDTVKEVKSGLTVRKTIDREKLWAVQTPQTFKWDLLKRAYASVKKRRAKVTDDAAAVELLRQPVHLVPAPLANIKITTPDDLTLASGLLNI
jgi:2-C-methyl-D-erythritol 4-phosphate cytidylyltransferase